MSQEQIELPEPDGYTWHEGRIRAGAYVAGFGFSLDKPPANPSSVIEQEVAEVYFSTTVRRLIAEAVAAEREACALACDEAKAQSRNHLFRSGLSIAAGAIRTRGDKT